MISAVKGGGYVTHKHLQQIGVSASSFGAMSQQEQEQVIGWSKIPVFTTWQEADVYLESAEFKKSLTPADNDAIKGYTANSYYADLNKAMAHEALYGRAMPENFKKIEQQLQQTLQKFPKYSGTVYRKVSPSGDIDAFLKGYTEGKTVEWPAFSSTSTAKGVWGGNIQFTIQTTGKKAHPVFKHSTFPHEHEVLFEKQARFTIKKVTPTYSMQAAGKDPTKPIYNTLKSGKKGKKIIGYQPLFSEDTSKITGARIELEEI